ncbi:MAG: hypothetical protein AB7O67_03620 [Vicinamibacterales bacterium]
MEKIGYPATWVTHCFLDGGCRQQGLFGHTNGFGDFVLFDALGWPWPIHDCYARRFELAETSGSVRFRSTAGVAVAGKYDRPVDSIFEVTADLQAHRAGLDIIGTVTNVESGFIGKSSQFRALGNVQRDQIAKALAGRTSHIVVASGDGKEFGVFADLRAAKLRFKDTVAVRVKPIRLLNQVVFVATKLVKFSFDS